MQDAGHENAYLCHFIANDEYRYDMPAISFWALEDGPGSKAKYLQDFDIIHVHNEPNFSYFLANLKEFFPNTPIVFDAHDLDLIRFKDKAGEVARDAERKHFKSMTDLFIIAKHTIKRRKKFLI